MSAEQFQEAVELFKRTEVSDVQLLTAYAVLSATLQVHSWSCCAAMSEQATCLQGRAMAQTLELEHKHHTGATWGPLN